jgi:2-phospho-L-lactate guanylyltransferase
MQAQALAEAGGASRLLILPSDLPLISSEDVDALVAASERSAVVITPDRASEGTNALLLSPPLALIPSFGEASFDRHQQLAERASLEVAVVKRWGLALDLDTPADVLRLFAIGQECRAVRLLQNLDVTSRLTHLTGVQPAPSGV